MKRSCEIFLASFKIENEKQSKINRPCFSFSLLETVEELAFLGLQAAGSTLIYPFSVVRVLIQQGHEPIPPKKAKLFFGQTVYQLPSAWAYGKCRIECNCRL